MQQNVNVGSHTPENNTLSHDTAMGVSSPMGPFFGSQQDTSRTFYAQQQQGVPNNGMQFMNEVNHLSNRKGFLELLKEPNC